jgi:hypothetical protein
VQRKERDRTETLNDSRSFPPSIDRVGVCDLAIALQKSWAIYQNRKSRSPSSIADAEPAITLHAR